ncbi:M48 family metalloprotease [Knoellia sp. CPCC 206435]
MFFDKYGAPTASGWGPEIVSLQEAGFHGQGYRTLHDWDAKAHNAHSNCPALHATVLELKALVHPAWRARIDAIYAGRTALGDSLAESRHGKKGGVVAVSFVFTYTLLGAAITWGDFLHSLDEARSHSGNDPLTESHRLAVISAFDKVREVGAPALKKSKIFVVSSEAERMNVAQLQNLGEMWAVAHELSHHVLRHGTAAIDRKAQQLLGSLLAESNVSAEMAGLTLGQRQEIEADVLAQLLLAGEFSGDADPLTELQSAQGALVGLLAVGLTGGGWINEPTDTHPSTLTRLAFAGKVAAQRILRMTGLPLALREEQVRMVATVLAFAGWLAGVSISAGQGSRDEPYTSLADFMLVSVNLLLGDDAPIF